jgi:hypothetical protein
MDDRAAIVAETEAQQIAHALRSDGPNYVLGAAFWCSFMMKPPTRPYPSHFLAFKANGLVEPYDGSFPRLTPLGQQVRAHLKEQKL